MSYSEEQTRAYNSMLFADGVFEEMKKSLGKTKCPVHNKRLKLNSCWERNYDTDVFISNYCCTAFAEQMAKPFIEAGIFTSVTIEM